MIFFLLSFSGGIPFGDKFFTNIQFSTNGLMYLGLNFFTLRKLYKPDSSETLNTRDIALVAPFWDDFQTSNTSGKIYYKVNKKKGHNYNMFIVLF